MKLSVLGYNTYNVPWGYQDIRTILFWCIMKTDAEIICLQEVFSKYSQDEIKEFCRQSKRWTCYFANDSCKVGKITPFFHAGSGLAILVKDTVLVTGPPYTEAFQAYGGVDSLVNKGFLVIPCQKDSVNFQIVNTHFQSDISEFKPYYKSYKHLREYQEAQIANCMERLPCPIIVGDFNLNEFMHLHRFEKNAEVTHPKSGQHLDHCLTTVSKKDRFKKVDLHYFRDVCYSDHIPVLYELTIL